MGRFKVGAEVHDNDGFEGVIVGKPKKGWRDVAYQFGTVRVRKGELNFDRAAGDRTPKVCAEVCETEYKVGDRVVMADSVGGKFTEVPGTVRGKNLFVESLLVEFDSDVGFGHNGFGDADVEIASHRGWFITPDKLARVVAPTATAAWTPAVGDRVRVKCEADVFAAGIEIGAVGVVGSVSGSTLHVDFELDGDTFPQFAFLHQVEPLPVAPQPAGTTFTVKDGGTYVDRDGNKIGPVEVDGVAGHCVSFGGDNWAVSGVFNTYHPDEAPERDLVAEWVEPLTTWAPVAGKFGKTRDGRKVGPMVRRTHREDGTQYEGDFVWTDGDNTTSEGDRTWDANGFQYFNGDKDPSDLIAEWPAEVAEAGATATFKVGDRVVLLKDGLSTKGAVGMAGVIRAARLEDRYQYQIELDAGGTYKSHVARTEDYRFTWASVDCVAPEHATPHAKFKVGDRVVYKNDGLYDGRPCFGTVDRIEGGNIYASDWSEGGSWGFIPESDLRLATTPPLTIGTTVTLSAPAKIAGIYGDDANLSVNGAMFTLPLASLVAA